GAIDWALSMHPKDRPQSVEEFRSKLFSSNAAALGLQEALKRGAGEEEGAELGFAATLRSPRILKARIVRFFRNLWRPANWPIAIKMALAMMLTALAPLIIVAYYNYDQTQKYVTSVELRNLEQLPESTAGRIAQLLQDNRTLAEYVGTDEDFVAYLE